MLKFVFLCYKPVNLLKLELYVIIEDLGHSSLYTTEGYKHVYRHAY